MKNEKCPVPPTTWRYLVFFFRSLTVLHSEHRIDRHRHISTPTNWLVTRISDTCFTISLSRFLLGVCKHGDLSEARYLDLCSIAGCACTPSHRSPSPITIGHVHHYISHRLASSADLTTLVEQTHLPRTAEIRVSLSRCSIDGIVRRFCNIEMNQLLFE